MCCFEMQSLIESMRNPKTLFYSFWVSFLLLIIVYLLKYFISKECVRKDWGYIILELPIDVCLILITVVVTGYMKGETFASGVVLVLISIIISFFCCLFRRLSIKHLYDEKSLCKAWLWGIFDVVIAAFWISVVYNSII